MSASTEGHLSVNLGASTAVRRESKEKLTQQKKKKKKSISATPFLIKKPEKGQETIGEVVSIGEKFVTVKSEKQTIRRIPQNLKKVGRF